MAPEGAELNKTCRRMKRGFQHLLSTGVLGFNFPCIGHEEQNKACSITGRETTQAHDVRLNPLAVKHFARQLIDVCLLLLFTCDAQCGKAWRGVMTMTNTLGVCVYAPVVIWIH